MLTFAQPDSAFVEGLIRSEAAQYYERSMANALQSNNCGAQVVRDHGNNGKDAGADHSVGTLSNLYRPAVPSNMTPLERFAVLSTADDPCPWESKNAMSFVGLEQGSLETLDARRQGAIALAGEEKAKADSSRCNSVAL